MLVLARSDCHARTKHNLQYQLRIREKDDKDRPHHCLNCFVSFKQCRDYRAARGFSQSSLVLVCRHPFATLAFKILKVLAAVIDTLPPHSILGGQDNGPETAASASSCPLQCTLETAMSHAQAWPQPVQDSSLELPFFGEMLSFSVPTLSSYLDMGVETDPGALQMQTTRSSAASCDASCSEPQGERSASTIYSNNKSSTYGLGGGSGMFADDNLVELFKPLGLLPHLWTLWELVVTGSSIVVWSPSPDLCSRVVAALVSLCAPLVYGGDFRPYINPYDSDVAAISRALAERAACAEQQQADDRGSGGGEAMSPGDEAGGDSGSLPWEYKLQSFNRRAQGMAASGGEVGSCCGGDSASSSSSSSASSSSPASVDNIRTQNNDSSSSNNKRTLQPPVIVGITNPFLLRALDQADAALFLPLPDDNKPVSPFAGARQRKHSLFSSRVSSSETPASSSSRTSSSCTRESSRSASPPQLFNDRQQSVDIALPSAAVPIPLQRNRTTEGRMQHQHQHQHDSTPPRPRPHPISFQDVPPPPPPLHHSQSAPYPSGRGLRLHGCHVNRIDRSTTLDVAYERWVAAGGVGSGGSHGSTLLTLRAGVSVKPDQTMLHRLLHSSLDSGSPHGSMCSSPTRSASHSPSNSDVNSGSSSAYGFLGNLLGELGGVLNGSSALDPRHDPQHQDLQAVMGNMLIREHFRQLTHALMKPFENHFQGSLHVPPSPPHRAAGAAARSGQAVGGESYFSFYTGTGAGSGAYNMNADLQSSGSGAPTGNYGIVVPPPAPSTPGGGTFWESTGISLLDPFGSSAESSPPALGPPPLPSSFVKDRDNDREQAAGIMSSINKEVKSNSTANTSLTSMSPSRRGASSLWLYRNPSDLLGRRSTAESVAQYLSSRAAAKSLPDAFLSGKRQQLFTAFGRSHTFQNYFCWRKAELTTAVLLDLSQACSSLSAEELVEQLAIEQGSDILTQAQMQDLASRIGLYILAISSEHNKHCGHYPSTVDRCGKGSSTESSSESSSDTSASSGLRSALQQQQRRQLESSPPPSQCVCCRHFQQHHSAIGGRAGACASTDEVVGLMQDHLNAVVALMSGTRGGGGDAATSCSSKSQVEPAVIAHI